MSTEVVEKCGVWRLEMQGRRVTRYGSDVPMFGIDFMSAVKELGFSILKIEREHRDSTSWEMFDDINCTVPESV